MAGKDCQFLLNQLLLRFKASAVEILREYRFEIRSSLFLVELMTESTISDQTDLSIASNERLVLYCRKELAIVLITEPGERRGLPPANTVNIRISLLVPFEGIKAAYVIVRSNKAPYDTRALQGMRPNDLSATDRGVGMKTDSVLAKSFLPIRNVLPRAIQFNQAHQCSSAIRSAREVRGTSDSASGPSHH